MHTSANCHDEQRRHAVRHHTDRETGQRDLNGIDYLEVSDDQRELTLHFLRKAPPQLSPANIRIDGGRRITNIVVEQVWPCLSDDPELDDCLKLRVDRPGDFSTYTLRLVEPDARGQPGEQPLAGFDPRYAQIAFSFKVNCASELDCRVDESCAPEPLDAPEINYLAKDYASFRQLILDRLALQMPEWRERHVPDLGIALVEVLAYVGDHLSYYQDAVATEAYLDTARQRISVRRHARLVDYHMHDGCNARAWLCLETDSDLTLPADDLFFITGYNDVLPLSSSVITADDLAEVPRQAYEVFEPIGRGAIQLYRDHNQISFYTWGDRECCLPRGSTSATLRDEWRDPAPTPAASAEQTTRNATPPGQIERKPTEPGGSAARERLLKLRVGDVLIFEEVLGPKTGVPTDADVRHRHAVRLTSVEPTVDRLYDQDDPDGVPVVEIGWAVEDALPFALCISAFGRAPECAYREDISIARGNVILVDHGASDRRTTDEELPRPTALPPDDMECEPCTSHDQPLRTARYRPQLRYGPLTQRESLPSPALIAQQQARLITEIVPRVQARIRQLWQQVQAGQTLRPAELDELRTIFGARALAQSGLEEQTGSRARHRRPPAPQSERKTAAALSWLLRHQDQLLRRKVRRITLLDERARSGYMLDSTLVAEIGALFGPAYTTNLAADDPALLGPASTALHQSPRAALPVLVVCEQSEAEDADSAADERCWWPRRDLLESAPGDRHVVVEVDDAGAARLRFGDGTLGRAPTPVTALRATYRIGNGAAGNVGAEAISQLVMRHGTLSGVVIRPRNPLPAQGGLDPELVSRVKLFAPTIFRSELQRAVTADDYARLAERHPRVQRAAAVLRWNGSWHTVTVAIDALAGADTTIDAPADEALLGEIERMLYPYRRIGHDLDVTAARYVPLDIEMTVCVQPSYLRGHVHAALLDAFSSRVLPDGRRGLFHADNLTFGTPIYLSQLIATAQAIPGVETVAVNKLDRLYEPASDALDTGKLALEPLEIARLNNDPNAPDQGKLRFTLRGGR